MTVYSVPAYLAFNRGTSTGTGSQQTIAHGLVVNGSGVQPKRVRIFPTATDAIISQVAPDTINIYPTVTNGKTFLWIAEYW